MSFSWSSFGRFSVSSLKNSTTWESLSYDNNLLGMHITPWDGGVKWNLTNQEACATFGAVSKKALCL